MYFVCLYVGRSRRLLNVLPVGTTCGAIRPVLEVLVSSSWYFFCKMVISRSASAQHLRAAPESRSVIDRSVRPSVRPSVGQHVVGTFVIQ